MINLAQIKEFKSAMIKTFDLSLLNSYREIEVIQQKNQIAHSQKPYAAKNLDVFEMMIAA